MTFWVWVLEKASSCAKKQLARVVYFVHCQPLSSYFSLILPCRFTTKPLSARTSSLFILLHLSFSAAPLHPSSVPLSFIAPVVLTMCEWDWMMGGKEAVQCSFTRACTCMHIETRSYTRAHTQSLLVGVFVCLCESVCWGGWVTLCMKRTHTLSHTWTNQHALI